MNRLVFLFRKKEQYLLGYLTAKHALTMPYPGEEHCVDYTIYEYKMLVEFINCALKLGKFQEGIQACTKIMENPNVPDNVRGATHYNYELAKAKSSNP